jgi:hypothetical protein
MSFGITSSKSLTQETSFQLLFHHARFILEIWQTWTSEMKEAFMPFDTGARGRNIFQGCLAKKYQGGH